MRNSPDPLAPKGRRRTRRYVVATAGLIVIAVACTLWWQGPTQARFDTVPVGRSHIESSVTAIGTLQPHRYVDVGAQVSGQILKLHVEPGAQIHKGQLLVEIDPSVQQATVDASRAGLAGLHAQLADSQAQYKLARQQFARQQLMAKEGATRLEDLQIAEAAQQSGAAKIDHLKAQINQTQATLKADEARLGYTSIYGSMAGTVVSVEAREGQTLNATYQTPNILRIADLSVMTVWTEVSEADVRRVKPGMPVYFTTLGADQRRWEGKVRQVLPAPPVPEGKSAGTPLAPSTSKVILYTVLFDVDNPDAELMSQMTAQVSFVTAAAPNSLAVPLPALTARPEQPGWYTARVLRDDGHAEERAVRVGVKNRLLAQVLEGLSEGEQLVTGERHTARGVRRFQL